MKANKKIVTLVLVGMLSVGVIGCDNKIEDVNTEPVTNVGATKDKEIIDKVIVDDEYAKVTLISAYRIDEPINGVETGFNIRIENKADFPISVWAENASISNEMIMIGCSGTVSPGCNASENWYFFTNDGGASLDIDLEQIQNMEFEAQIVNETTCEVVSKTSVSIN